MNFTHRPGLLALPANWFHWLHRASSTHFEYRYKVNVSFENKKMSSINDLSGERNNVCGSLLYESISEIIIGKAVLMYWRAHEGRHIGGAPQHLTYGVTPSNGESFLWFYKVLVVMSKWASVAVRFPKLGIVHYKQLLTLAVLQWSLDIPQSHNCGPFVSSPAGLTPHQLPAFIMFQPWYFCLSMNPRLLERFSFFEFSLSLAYRKTKFMDF